MDANVKNLTATGLAIASLFINSKTVFSDSCLINNNVAYSLSGEAMLAVQASNACKIAEANLFTVASNLS